MQRSTAARVSSSAAASSRAARRMASADGAVAPPRGAQRAESSVLKRAVASTPSAVKVKSHHAGNASADRARCGSVPRSHRTRAGRSSPRTALARALAAWSAAPQLAARRPTSTASTSCCCRRWLWRVTLSRGLQTYPRATATSSGADASQSASTASSSGAGRGGRATCSTTRWPWCAQTAAWRCTTTRGTSTTWTRLGPLKGPTTSFPRTASCRACASALGFAWTSTLTSSSGAARRILSSPHSTRRRARTCSSFLQLGVPTTRTTLCARARARTPFRTATGNEAPYRAGSRDSSRSSARTRSSSARTASATRPSRSPAAAAAERRGSAALRASSR
mmetsp:Transcript_22255/g.77118  ORF Transcript_22255/g.77118 Transcript_22255/m.77118 type:complete len:337 (-) Transcript_22255:106-1116(-)